MFDDAFLILRSVDQHLGAGVGNDVRHLLCMQPRIDRHHDEPGRETTVNRFEDARAVGEAECDAVTCLEAQRQQIAADRERTLVELAISDLLGAMYQREAVRSLTPASSNVAISRSVAPAAATMGSATSAPVPSPSRMP